VRPVFILYPEIYLILCDHMNDDRLAAPARDRIIALVSCWENALQSHGDAVEKVEVFLERGEWTWQASTKS